MDWSLERHVGSAAAFHARDLPEPARRAVWRFTVTEPTVVLGSAQPFETVDARRAAAAGVTVARRRSGGGAVWLDPTTVTWIDVVLPAGDRLWVDDVTTSSAWLGRVWVDVLAGLDVANAEVYAGPMVRSVASGLVCFAGRAAGEILVEGRKVVGISQRRTRNGARFQCAVHHRWDPAPLVEVLDLGNAERAGLLEQLIDAAVGVDVDADRLVDAFVSHLRRLD